MLGVWISSHVVTRKGHAPSGEKRIAVLPFKPLLPENRDQVLEMGMADTLIAKLSNSREIIVSSLNSVRKFVSIEQDSLAAGRELQVNSVLEGTVQRARDRIRVTARLIKVADGSSLWSGTFDEKFTDVFAVQDAISQRVADALALRLAAKKGASYPSDIPITSRPISFILQAVITVQAHSARDPGGDEFFQQAIDRDPNYALAYFGLAEANRSLAITSDVPSKDSLPQAKAAAQKALAIDDSLAEAHAYSLLYSDLVRLGLGRCGERIQARNCT